MTELNTGLNLIYIFAIKIQVQLLLHCICCKGNARLDVIGLCKKSSLVTMKTDKIHYSCLLAWKDLNEYIVIGFFLVCYTDCWLYIVASGELHCIGSG